MKCLKVLTPLLTTSDISLKIFSDQFVIDMWKPKSHDACLFARSNHSSNATNRPLSSGTIISIMVVVPPESAANVPLSHVSAVVVPMKGISK